MKKSDYAMTPYEALQYAIKSLDLARRYLQEGNIANADLNIWVAINHINETSKELKENEIDTSSSSNDSSAS